MGASRTFTSILAYPGYADAPGEFKGESTLVECQALNDYLVDFEDTDSVRVLSISISESIDGPIDILQCTWLPVTRFPVADDFDLSNQTGFVGFTPPVPFHPGVYISNIDCTGTIETTTTTTTTTTMMTSTTTLPPAVCGDYDGNGDVTIADALGVLRTSVGLADCDLCVCDVDDDGSNSISDALRALRLAVGQDVTLSCAQCL